MDTESNYTLEVKMGEYHIAAAPAVLYTGGIGSCVAVCLYSHLHKVGALAHVMLPVSSAPVMDNDFRYADIAIQSIINTLAEQQVGVQHLVAKIVGGANMFPNIQGRSPKVGERNVESVKAVLQGHGITVAAEEIGGSAGRAASFDLGNGIVTIKMTI